MDEAATIFCLTSDPRIVVDVLSRCGDQVRSVGSPNDWEMLEAQWGNKELTISRKMFEPGGDFSQIVLGAHNYFRTMDAESHPGKNRVLSVLERCDMMLGIRADPAFCAGEDRLRCVLILAEALEGLIFDGQDMLDHTGKVVYGPGVGKPQG